MHWFFFYALAFFHLFLVKVVYIRRKKKEEEEEERESGHQQDDFERRWRNKTIPHLPVFFKYVFLPSWSRWFASLRFFFSGSLNSSIFETLVCFLPYSVFFKYVSLPSPGQDGLHL